MIEHLNPRGCRVVALEKPNERELTQWYFQRYVAHLPAGGEIVLFDRSWYNRAGVERVMGFTVQQKVIAHLRATPEFERLLISSGIKLVRFWFSVSKQDQEQDNAKAYISRPSTWAHYGVYAYSIQHEWATAVILATLALADRSGAF